MMSGPSRVDSISLRYREIYNKFYKPLAQSRRAVLRKAIYEFFDKASDYLPHDQFDFFVDDIRLRHCVMSYFFDLIRHKDFHFSPKEIKKLGNPEAALKYIAENNVLESERVHTDEKYGGAYVNDAKQAAYLVKWFVRTKPILVAARKNSGLSCENDTCPRKELPDPSIGEVQENLIVSLNEQFAIIYACAILGIDTKREDAWVQKTAYHLHYRCPDEGNLIELFELKAA
jgi:hypothetical protein